MFEVILGFIPSAVIGGFLSFVRAGTKLEKIGEEGNYLLFSIQDHHDHRRIAVRRSLGPYFRKI